MTILADLGITLPVLAAPMAGGPTTPELVLAAASVDSAGFLAAGYKTPELMAEQLAAVGDAPFGVNLFAPNPLPVDRTEYETYRISLARDAERFGVTLPFTPVEDDDHWRDKIDVLLEHPVPIVSFTFGIPDAAVLAALRRAGTVVAQTVTSSTEARQAVEAAVDVLVVQSFAAGGHSGTLTPTQPPPALSLVDLLADVAAQTTVPLIAAGGLDSAEAVADVLHAGAIAAFVGTALLLAPECGTSEAYRKALRQDRGDTVVTRAFTGRPARALSNGFLSQHDASAPLGYPAIHYLTSPLRKAAAGLHDSEFVNLWAGTGYRSVTARPAGEILRALAAAT